MGNDEVSTNNNEPTRFVPKTTLDEVMDIAIANGYEGAYPNNIADAVAALGTVVSGGGGGGGAAGYDVTKVWAVPEQTVTSHEVVDGGSSWYDATITVGDLAQMYTDGQRSVIAALDGVAVTASILFNDNTEPATYLISDNQNFDVYFSSIDNAYVVSCYNDTEPTTHTVSAYYADATTTADFDAAVKEASDKAELKVTFTPQIGGPDQTSGVADCDRTFDEIMQATMSGVPMTYWLDMGFGKWLLGMPNPNLQTGFPDITFTFFDPSSTVMRTCVVSVTSDESGQPSEWQYTLTETEIGSGDVVLARVQYDPYDTGGWTCSVSAPEIYNAVLSGAVVELFVSYQGNIYKVTDLYVRLSGTSYSTAEYTGHFWYPDETGDVLVRGLVQYDYTSDTLTVTQREKVYQLTPAS